MLPRINHGARHLSNSGHAGRHNPAVSRQFPRQIRILPPNHPSPNRPFDSRPAGTRFHVEAVPLGRGAARDAAGRAGSLRGPAASFLCADGDLATARKDRPTGNSYLIANQLDSCYGAVYKRDTAKMPYFKQVLCSPKIGRLNRRLIFGVRPHECQIGSGEEFRPAVRLRHSRVASDFLVSANLHSPSSEIAVWPPAAKSALDSVLKFAPKCLRTAPSGTNAIHSVISD
jgi:hypothetical protein